MAVYSIIQKSQLEGAKRLDAEYYQPEYFIDFTKGTWIPIGDVLETCQYGLSLAMNDNKKGYPMFKMDDIHDNFLFDDEVRYADVSPELFEPFKVEKDDIFFNRVNSEEFVGRTGIYKMSKDAIFASYLIKIRPRIGSEILPDYLNIFLNSAYGQRQIRKYARRAVNQANVNAEELKRFRIFIAPLSEQNGIAGLSNESWDHYEKAKSLYSQAEEMLLEGLQLSSEILAKEEGLYSVVNLLEVKATGRMDAEYFQPKYEKLRAKLKEYGVKNLPDVIQDVSAKFVPEPDTQYRYIELADINVSLGVIDDGTEMFGKKLPSRARRIVKTNDVLASSVEGSLGKVALVGRAQNGFLASTGFFQFRSKDILPEVLLVLAKSVVLRSQMEQRCAGTILTAVPKESIKDILIPILPETTQQKIADLVKKSHEARVRAKELLEQAKSKVEEIIEKN